MAKNVEDMIDIDDIVNVRVDKRIKEMLSRAKIVINTEVL
jgi:hypothetical protein